MVITTAIGPAAQTANAQPAGHVQVLPPPARTYGKVRSTSTPRPGSQLAVVPLPLQPLQAELAAARGEQGGVVGSSTSGSTHRGIVSPYMERGAPVGTGKGGGNSARAVPSGGALEREAADGTGSGGGNPARAVPFVGAQENGVVEGTGSGGGNSARAVPTTGPATTSTSASSTTSCTRQPPGGTGSDGGNPVRTVPTGGPEGHRAAGESGSDGGNPVRTGLPVSPGGHRGPGSGGDAPAGPVPGQRPSPMTGVGPESGEKRPPTELVEYHIGSPNPPKNRGECWPIFREPLPDMARQKGAEAHRGCVRTKSSSKTWDSWHNFRPNFPERQLWPKSSSSSSITIWP